MKQLTVGSEKYPCRITTGAMIRFKNQFGRDISAIDSEDIEQSTFFVYACVKSSCKRDGVDFDMSFEDFADNLLPEDLAEFFTETASEVQKKTQRKAKN